MTMLEFDLNSPPPTIEQIEVEREWLTARKTTLIKRACLGAFLTWSCLMGFIFILSKTDSLHLVLLESLLAAIVAMSFLYWLSRPNMRLSTINKRIRTLKPLPAPITDERHAKVFEYCYRNKLCKSYLVAVLKQDRPLTVGEADVIVNCGKEAVARHAAERKRLICRGRITMSEING
ncbi:MAG: hypothetical protein WBB23_16180 [Desulforhopalus sp.]